MGATFDSYDTSAAAAIHVDTDDLLLLAQAAGMALHGAPGPGLAARLADPSYRGRLQGAMARVRLASELAESALWPDRCAGCGHLIDGEGLGIRFDPAGAACHVDCTSPDDYPDDPTPNLDALTALGAARGGRFSRWVGRRG